MNITNAGGDNAVINVALENKSKTSSKMSYQSKYRWFRKIKPMFWVIVIIPTLISSIYYGFIATEVYVSESQFVVRSPKNAASLTGIGAFLQSAGFARSSDDTYTVHAYMRSRDALNELNKDNSLSSHYEDKGVDWISRFNSLGLTYSVERLFQYFQNKVVLDLDTASSISTLKIK